MPYPMRTALALGLMLILSTVPARGQEVTVTATGQGTSESEALQMAQRAAVEQGCGVFIQSQSQTENFVLVKDQIYSESKGFIAKYDIVQKQQQGNVISLTIRAIVSKKALEGRWAFYEETLKRVGRPKIMFMIALRHNNVLLPAEMAENQLANPFVEGRCFVVDKQNLDEQKRIKLAAANATGNMNEMLALAKENGADVLIRGEVAAEEMGRERPGESYGGMDGQLRYMFTFTMRILRISDSKIMFTKSDKQDFAIRTQNPKEALNIAAIDWSKMIAPYFRKKTMAVWAFEAQNYISFNLEVQNIKFTQVRALRSWLEQQPWVSTVIQDRFAMNIVKLRIESKLTRLDTVADKLAEQKVVKLEVTDMDQSTVKAKVPEGE